MSTNHPLWTAAEALAAGRRLLANAVVHSADEAGGCALDAEVLLRYVLGVDRTRLYLEPDLQLTSDEALLYRSLLNRRAAGEPAAYLTGTREFFGLEFAVNPAVLIPRPETELLVEIVLENLRPLSGSPLIIDVGTGSGAIAVSLAANLNVAEILAIEVSGAALQVARENAARNNTAHRIAFLEGDLLEAVPAGWLGRTDWITANLPYIPSGEIPGLQKDVTDYEPHLALDGGTDGLDLYRRLIPRAERILRPGGGLIMEIGPDQGRALFSMLNKADWEKTEIIRDYAQLDRFVLTQKASGEDCPKE